MCIICKKTRKLKKNEEVFVFHELKTGPYYRYQYAVFKLLFNSIHEPFHLAGVIMFDIYFTLKLHTKILRPFGVYFVARLNWYCQIRFILP